MITPEALIPRVITPGQLIQAITTAENLSTIPPVVVNGNAETKTVLIDVTDKRNLVKRYIQNTGATDIYYAFGTAANFEQYHGWLPPGQQLDCSKDRNYVSVWGAGVWQVATYESYRAADL